MFPYGKLRFFAQCYKLWQFLPFFHTLANFQLMFLWKVGVFWQKLMTFWKIKIVLSFKCHVTFRLQTKRITRTFQTSRIKIKNHNHVTSVSINGFSNVKKSFEQVCFIRQILQVILFSLQCPFWLVASNDSFSLELM